jgi:hypothetical protein
MRAAAAAVLDGGGVGRDGGARGVSGDDDEGGDRSNEIDLSSQGLYRAATLVPGLGSTRY